MFNYTKHTLGKFETLFKEQEFTIRYEKGSFQSGYCVVENRSIIIINKFFDTEARINTLIDLLNVVEIQPKLFTEKSARFYKEVMKSEAVQSPETEDPNS